MSKKILILTLLITIFMCMAGCGEKTANEEQAMTREEFVMIMLKNEYPYQLFKISEEKAEWGEVYYARAAGMPTAVFSKFAEESDEEETGTSLLGFTESGLEIYSQVYFCEFGKTDDAVTAYEKIAAKLEAEEAEKDTFEKDDAMAFAFCDYDGYFERYYMVVSRVENTILVAQIPEGWLEQTEKMFQGTVYETAFAGGKDENE